MAAVDPAQCHTRPLKINASAVSAGNSLYVTIQGSWGTLGQGFRPLSLIGATKTVSGVAVMRKEG